MLCGPMKKLAIIIATASLAFAAPVFACPHDEAAAPKTAEKSKDAKGTTSDSGKAKEAPKKEEGTTAKKKEEPKQDTTKKPEKTAQK
jgi:hypothetical protein